MSMLREPHVDAVAKVLTEALRQARDDTRPIASTRRT
jgi:hypothetical protein